MWERTHPSLHLLIHNKYWHGIRIWKISVWHRPVQNKITDHQSHPWIDTFSITFLFYADLVTLINITNDGLWMCKTNRPVFMSWNYCQWIHVLQHSRLHDCAWRLKMMDCSGFHMWPVWPAGCISSLLQRLTAGCLFSVQMITCPMEWRYKPVTAEWQSFGVGDNRNNALKINIYWGHVCNNKICR